MARAIPLNQIAIHVARQFYAEQEMYVADLTDDIRICFHDMRFELTDDMKMVYRFDVHLLTGEETCEEVVGKIEYKKSDLVKPMTNAPKTDGE